MTGVYVPESLPPDSQYAFEATQLSQPQFSQTQNTQFISSQVEPRRKYWAILIPINPQHRILKIPWSRSTMQMGRGPAGPTGNDVVIQEKRVSNKHCKVTLGLTGTSKYIGDEEPDVWIEDLKSSNGTFVNGERLKGRRLLRHGDEVSLGHHATLDNHDVRYIFRSVGSKGTQFGTSDGKLDNVGEVYEKYQFLDILGTGTFAEVRKAVDIETGDLRAIKQIVKHRFANNPKTLELFRREIDICQSLQHENICRLIQSFEDPQHVCLVLEYVDGGDLLDTIMKYENPKGGGLPEDFTAALTLQICRAMAYTHAKGVTHRDLKPENILLTKETPDTPPQVKVADFGLAKMVHNTTMLVSMVGTPQYLAPEVVMQNKHRPGYENVVDSWSVGIIVYSMLTKALPFDEDETLPVDKRIKARFTQEADTSLLRQLNVSDLCIDFIGRLLAKEPYERMTLTEALEHDWLALPSSQHSEAPAYPLGGDSMYGIQDFDRSSSASESFEAAEWSRPMTASGTNLESGMGLADYREESVESDDSYSQKVQNIQLNSDPAIGRSRPHPLTLSVSNKDIEANGNGDHGNGDDGNASPADGSPPSPPLTAKRMDLEVSTNTKPPNGNPAYPPTPNEAIIHTERVETPGTATKRKALEVDLFASGSLSPPPAESMEFSSPTTSTHKPQRQAQPQTPQSEPSPIENENGEEQAGRGGNRRTTRSTVKPPATTTPVTRGRKSMRLA